MTVSNVFRDPERAATLYAQLVAGVEGIERARQAALEDIPVAEAQRDTAQAHRAAAVNQRTQVAGFTPGLTYRPADITAIRDQLAIILDRQSLILAALADSYTYRAAVDQNAVTTDDALLWLARLAAGTLDTNGA